MNRYSFGWGNSTFPFLQCEDIEVILDWVYKPSIWIISLQKHQVISSLREIGRVEFEFTDSEGIRISISAWIEDRTNKPSEVS